MHILGLANGTPSGNSEILLKAALTAATEADSTITTSWIHVPSISIPTNPAPLDSPVGFDLASKLNVASNNAPDDRAAVREAILDADAIIVSTPTYSHQPLGTLKLLMDRIGGPALDVTFGKTFNPDKLDPRLSKPRVLGFIAVGGSSTPDQFTMVLPTLHLLFYALHAKTVDQFIGQDLGSSGAVCLHDDLISRAKRMGQNIASQIGKSYDDATYQGDEEAGACPHCHLSKIEFLPDHGKNAIGCTTCGTRGNLTVSQDGNILPVWEEESKWSCLTWAGKLQHSYDIISWAKRDEPRKADIKKGQEEWKKVVVSQVTLPSQDKLSS
ncbi:flavo protein [Aureobasidium pullulans]|uniref:Flavo protein n=1 Tax=Aureobasidium pullulans TaxID=5580 RepID=A0A4S9QC81_AURPU|nr:flavo protein [Aureobasidium pullulans]THW08635.1 flavo protein [Aureobasidium pullulans]THY81756.1 flavo protein [Aureobasidium pullulans]